MKNLRRNFERFCYKNKNKGIPSLMLFVAVGNAIVYLFSYIDPSYVVYRFLQFDRSLILHGQVWRLLTYVLIPNVSSGQTFGVLLLAIMLFFYYFIGRTMEAHWGTLKFTLFYFCGVLLTDVGALILNVSASAYYLNLSLILAYATLFPENMVLFMMIIPIRMKYLAWFYFALTAWEIATTSFPYNLLPVFALLNYFLFFGADVKNVLPRFGGSRRPTVNPGQVFRQKQAGRQQSSESWAGRYASQTGQPAYHHKCTICGRTDTEYPNLEFRYCSKCNGYYCYCEDHINNHIHIV